MPKNYKNQLNKVKSQVVKMKNLLKMKTKKMKRKKKKLKLFKNKFKKKQFKKILKKKKLMMKNLYKNLQKKTKKIKKRNIRKTRDLENLKIVIVLMKNDFFFSIYLKITQNYILKIHNIITLNIYSTFFIIYNII